MEYIFYSAMKNRSRIIVKAATHIYAINCSWVRKHVTERRAFFDEAVDMKHE